MKNLSVINTKTRYVKFIPFLTTLEITCFPQPFVTVIWPDMRCPGGVSSKHALHWFYQILFAVHWNSLFHTDTKNKTHIKEIQLLEISFAEEMKTTSDKVEYSEHCSTLPSSANIRLILLTPYYPQPCVSNFCDIRNGWLCKISCKISIAMFDNLQETLGSYPFLMARKFETQGCQITESNGLNLLLRME